MKLLILTWLVRGLNNPQKRDFVKNLLKEWRCSSPFVDWTVLDAVDTVGGCYYYWKKKGVGEN